MIFNSPFNQDLGVKALSRSSQYCSVDAWFDYLARLAKEPEPKFPYGELSGYKKPDTPAAATPSPPTTLPV